MSNPFEEMWSERVRPTAEEREAPAAEPAAYRAWATLHAELTKPCLVVYLSGQPTPHVLHESQFRRFRPLEDGTLAIITVDVIFRLRGRHLDQLPLAWATGRATVLQEFDAARWPFPEGDVPVIETIEVLDALGEDAQPAPRPMPA